MSYPKKPEPSLLNASETDSIKAQAANLIHDLRTPLLAMKGFTGQLQDFPTLQASITKQLDKINHRLEEFWKGIHIEEAAIELEPTICRAESERRDLHIMVVDDDGLIREIAQRVLEKEGYHVSAFASGTAAIKALHNVEIDGREKAGQTIRFDAIFLDINMPGLSGLDLAAQITASESKSKIPFIIGMSSDPRVAYTKQQCIDSGMDGYMEKPITLEKCLEALAGVSGR